MFSCALKSTVTGLWCILLFLSLTPSFPFPVHMVYLVFVDALVLKFRQGGQKVG